MKKLFAIVILGLAVISMIGCGGGGTSASLSDKTTVTINIGTTSASAKAIAGIPPNISKIGFSVSGPDMETITRTVSTEGRTVISETFEVPNGLHRHFILKAMDTAGMVVYIGDTYANLHGVPVHLSIDMATINLTGPWSADHIEADGSNLGRDCITLTQTGNSLAMAPTYPNDKYTGSGSVNGDRMQLTFTTGRVDCGIENTTIVTGGVADGNTLSGTFVVNTGCGNTVHGIWKAVRDSACVPVYSEPPTVDLGTIAGVVKDSSTQAPIAGVSIKLYKQDIAPFFGMTGSNGAYSMSVPAGSGYTIEFSKTGYLPSSLNNITVTANATTTLQTVLLTAGTASGIGNISGKVTNALTGQGAGNITINLRAGKDITTGPVVATTTTQSDGTYSFNGINAGDYTAEASGSGYITTYFNVVCVANATMPNQNAAISPVLATGETRIVLTWGAMPSDLDSHLTGPAPDSSRFHIYFANPGYSYSGIKYVDLDLDDTSSYGPETTTIYKQISGVYKFYVHDYSNGGSTNSTALSNSGAMVKVYRGNSVVATFNVPANQGGTVWTVFELNGDAITTINTLSYNESGIQSLSIRKQKGN